MPDFELILERDPIRVGEPVRGEVRADAQVPRSAYVLTTGYVKLRVHDLSDGTTRQWVESKSPLDEDGRFELPSPTMPSYVGSRLLVEWNLTFEAGPEEGAREFASIPVYCEVPPEHRALVLDGKQSLRRQTSAVWYTIAPVASVFLFFRVMVDGAVAFAVFLVVASAVSIVLGLLVAWRDRLIIRQRLALEEFSVELAQATPPVLSFVVEPNRDLTLSRAYLVVECYERHHDSAWSRFRNRFSRFAYPADVTSTATIELDLPERIPGLEPFTHEVPLELPRDAPFTIRRFPGTNARWRGRLVLETEELETIEGPFDFQVVLPKLLTGSDEPGLLVE